ncbi:MAG: DUF4160 domain-containing protein [Planctomycetia bacterium]|nr:DUF4160 domain-containing protein [Planctomycetia bacterium]
MAGQRRRLAAVCSVASSVRPPTAPLGVLEPRPGSRTNFGEAEDFPTRWLLFFFYSNDHPPIHVHVRQRP